MMHLIKIMVCFLVITLLVNVVLLDALLLPKLTALPKVTIDLRSDTLTKPSPAMRKAMFEAEVGDDVYEEDPTVNKLQLKVATMFGKESSLFFPTGTMANIAASMAWCTSRGSEAILGDKSHIYVYEQANLAQIGGISPRVVQNAADGTLDIDHIEHAIRQSNVHYPVTEMIALENTHNVCGGKVLPVGYVESVGALAKKAGVPLHMDGTRIWNAAAATRSSVAKLTAPVESISVCLSKGLGAPAGSLLLGPAAFIAKARRIRKALGGGMRQVGILAAAGLQAIEDFEHGLLDGDHAKAVKLAQGLSEISGLSVDKVDTNIVMVRLATGDQAKTDKFVAKLTEQGVKVLPFGARMVRLVTHRDITDQDVPAVVAAFRTVATKMWGASSAAALVIPALVLAELTHKELNVTANVSSSEASPAKEKRSKVAATEDTTSAPLETVAPVMTATVVPVPAAVVAPVVAPVVTPVALVAHTEPHNGDSSTHYEEVSIRGMSVSPDGFCVILQGLVSNRCVRVLVTPEDPMSDGLDHDEVESSEAVTLLQLLQGIDVESFLAKDALATKMGSTGPPGARVRYDLKAVLLNGIGRGYFQAVLAGSPKGRAAKSVEKESGAEGRVEVKSSAEEASGDAHPVNAGEHDLAALKNHTTTPTHLPSNTTVSGYEREVTIDSSFYAIALALRHRVPIEVRSDLLQNEKISFPEAEVGTSYPKLLAASVKPAAPQVKDRSHMVERLKKRLTEALRQRNAEKIAQIQEQIELLGAATTPAAAPVAAVQHAESSSADAALVSNASHETSPIE